MKKYTYYLILLLASLVLFGCGQVSKETGNITTIEADQTISVLSVYPWNVTPESDDVIFGEYAYIKTISIGAGQVLTVTATENNGVTLSYMWTGEGSFSATQSSTTTWNAPAEQGVYYPELLISNGKYIKKVKMALMAYDPSDSTPPTQPANLAAQREGDYLVVNWDKVSDTDTFYYKIGINASNDDDDEEYNVSAKNNSFKIHIMKVLYGEADGLNFNGAVVTINLRPYDYGDNSPSPVTITFNITGDFEPVSMLPDVDPTHNLCIFETYFRNKSNDKYCVTPDVVELYIDDELFETINTGVLNSDRYYFTSTANTSAYDVNTPYKIKIIGKKQSQVICEYRTASYVNRYYEQPTGLRIDVRSEVTRIDTSGISISIALPSMYRNRITFYTEVKNGDINITCSKNILTTPTGVTINLGNNTSYGYLNKDLPAQGFVDGTYLIESYQGDSIAVSRSFEMKMLSDEKIYDVTLSKSSISAGESTTVRWKNSGDSLKYYSVELKPIGYSISGAGPSDNNIKLGLIYNVISEQKELSIAHSLIQLPGRYRIIIKGYQDLSAFYEDSASNVISSTFEYKSDKVLIIK